MLKNWREVFVVVVPASLLSIIIQASSRQPIREDEISTVRMGRYLLHVCSKIKPGGGIIRELDGHRETLDLGIIRR